MHTDSGASLTLDSFIHLELHIGFHRPVPIKLSCAFLSSLSVFQTLLGKDVMAEKGYCTSQSFPGKRGFSADNMELHHNCQTG